MKIIITEAKHDPNIKKICCTFCGERIHGLGLHDGATVDGVSYRCKRCSKVLEIKVEK